MFNRQLKDSSESSARPLARDAREVYTDSVERIQEALDELSEKVSEQSRRVRNFTKQHPYQSMAIVFGMGSILGIILGVMKRN